MNTPMRQKSNTRWQYSLIPRFSSMDPQAEVTCYSAALTAIGHAKYRHRLYRVGRDKARQSKFYYLSPYAYCAGEPVNLVDPDGRRPSHLRGRNIGTARARDCHTHRRHAQGVRRMDKQVHLPRVRLPGCQLHDCQLLCTILYNAHAHHCVRWI